MRRAHFTMAQKALEQAGHHVALNPAMLRAKLPENKYLPIALAMLSVADAVFYLNGWANSDVAQLEFALARHLDKKQYCEGCKADCEKLGIEVETDAHPS